jgi:GNAT superfamily N-acetyltransferase
MTNEIRRAVVGDEYTLHELALATFALATTKGTAQSDIDAFIAQHLSAQRFASYLADPQRALFLASVDGEPSGYTMLVFGEPYDADVARAIESRPTVELSKVYARAEAHGTGLAAEMLRVTLEHARASGAASVWLGVNRHNPRANAFYEKNGFVVVGTKQFHIGDRLENDFVREHRLH